LAGNFKENIRSKKLANYDHVIAELRLSKTSDNRQADLARPDGKITVKRNLLAEESWGRPEPIYELSLQDIDELAGIIFAAAHVNPKYFTSGLKAARHYSPKGMQWRFKARPAWEVKRMSSPISIVRNRLRLLTIKRLRNERIDAHPEELPTAASRRMSNHLRGGDSNPPPCRVFLTILAALPPLPFLAKTLEKNHLGVFSPIFEKRLDLRRYSHLKLLDCETINARTGVGEVTSAIKAPS